MSSEDLPMILVAAKDSFAASKIISELIEKDVSNEGEGEAGSVWEISNKYYTAQAHVRALTDGHPAETSVDGVEAHIVYLAEDECTCEFLERRAARVRGAARGEGDVQLALADCTATALPQALEAAALRLNFELLPLRDMSAPSETDGDTSPPPPEVPPAGPFPELRGAARAREALHAHTWPNMQLATHVSPFANWVSNGVHEGSGSSSEGEGEPELEPEEAECVRRAELFADALCAIDGVRGAALAGAGEGGGRDSERLLRAEQLVAAFCRALGTDIDRL